MSTCNQLMIKCIKLIYKLWIITMKKLVISVVAALSYFTAASAEVGVNLGVSGQLGLFAASAKEVDTGPNITETAQDTELAGVGYGSVFIEKTLGDRLAVGIDFVPSALSSDTVETNKVDGSSDVTNKLKVDFEDLTTIYATLNVTEGMYVRAGIVTVDVITKETLGTGGSYGNTDLDGTVLGIGYSKTFDNSMFVRAEGNYMTFDSASITSSNSDNKVTLKNLDGVTGKLSIGKSF